ncbi:hypothetical protein Nepgr_032293 [Nepenthes gracilis]|uniref:Uncharacterized protein n=1 Tax=Nepenthes gracilis TaxID=150966 RepID=A0AAD3Y7K0_NEPGR|nr:hypothetical protein Nepgr_032293 [Nepenthes gracilis]
MWGSRVCEGIFSPVRGNAMEDGVLNQQTWSLATVANARGLASKMPTQTIVSDPSQAPCDVHSASAGFTPEEVGAPSGSMLVVTATGDTNAVQSVLDVEAPYVADLAADSPHRPLISTGVDGVANSVESGLIPGDPIEFQEVDSIPLSGCPVKGSEASRVEAVMICDPGRGLELTRHVRVLIFEDHRGSMILVSVQPVITAMLLYGFRAPVGPS